MGGRPGDDAVLTTDSVGLLPLDTASMPDHTVQGTPFGDGQARATRVPGTVMFYVRAMAERWTAQWKELYSEVVTSGLRGHGIRWRLGRLLQNLGL